MKKIIVLTAVLMLSACFSASLPSQFYMLEPEKGQTPISQREFSIGIEPVKIPGYLDKPQIVLAKINSPEMKLSETQRWAEALSSMMQRTLANDMGKYLPKAFIKSKTYGSEKFTYTVFVEIGAMDGILGDEAMLSVWWSVINPDGKVIAREQSNLKRPLGNSYADYVAAQSQLVNDLAEQIAKKLAKI